jgi:hypothetical protein
MRWRLGAWLVTGPPAFVLGALVELASYATATLRVRLARGKRDG